MSHRVFGEFCRPARLDPSMPVQLLLHGATYDHSYWSTLDLPAAGYVAHQVVDRLRDGTFGPHFRQVVLNTHSLGGLVAYDTARRGGVTAMIISGMPALERRMAGAFPPFYPAEQDPKFATRGWPTGYLTTMPDTRTELFLYPGTYAPAVPYVEEAWKDTVPEPELLAIGTPPTPVDVPTLSVLGSHDMFYCAETCPPVDSVIPNAGHSINMSRDAEAFYALTFAWLAAGQPS